MGRGTWASFAIGCTVWAFSATAAELPAQVMAESMPHGFPRIAGVDAITEGPLHHFTGGAGGSPWSADGRYLLYMESDFGDRAVEDHEIARIAIYDTQTGDHKIATKTVAWNFQYGAMAQWLGDSERIIYNDRVDRGLHAIETDVHTRKSPPHRLSTVADLSHDGETRASIDFSRLYLRRPDYGYVGRGWPQADEVAPERNMLHIYNLADSVFTSISLAEAYALAPPPRTGSADLFWFHHVRFSRDDKRVVFLGQAQHANAPVDSALFTVGTAGGDLRCILPYEWGTSYVEWADGNRLIAVAKYQGKLPWRHVLFTEGQQDYTILAPDLLNGEGHPRVSPDGQWMVTDSFPDENRYQRLFLVRLADNAGVEIGRFQAPPAYRGEWRCNLHPRWNRTGDAISIDSTHSGTRQVYVVKLDW